nr:ALT epitope protein 1 [synthetic construct]
MNKLLIAFGLVILFVTLPCVSESDEEFDDSGRSSAWTDRGCFCEDKLHSCVIERTNNGKLEYSYCAPEAGWQCA